MNTWRLLYTVLFNCETFENFHNTKEKSETPLKNALNAPPPFLRKGK